MDFDKCLFGRRSVRKYKETPVSDEHVEKILTAGAAAPSAHNSQPCRFIVITNKNKITEISNKIKASLHILGEKYAERSKLEEDVVFYGAPLLILIVAEEETNWTQVDCALSAENMMLEGYNLGLGSCYIGFMNLLDADEEYLATLGITKNQKLYSPIIFGYPEEWPPVKHKKPKIQKRIR